MSCKFIVASHNLHKLEELREILVPLGFSVVGPDDVGGISEPEENGTTFEENALIKARSACKETGLAAIADDSGLCVDALDGAPGIYSARFAGTGNSDDNNALLLEKLKNVPYDKRTAHFVSCIACVFPDGREFTVRGECKGNIATEPEGSGGFGYDPVFLVPELGATFSELSSEEKNRISHRGKALRLFAQKLNEEFFHADK